MADISLTQAEADALIALEKHRVSDDQHEFPSLGGGSVEIPLQSADKREAFLLDISRGRIDLSKGTYQNRARKIVILVRLDFGGKPHRNPDDEEVPSPHLHLYREGFGDKWAIPAPLDRFRDTEDIWMTLQDFMRFCNVTRPPNIVRGIFS